MNEEEGDEKEEGLNEWKRRRRMNEWMKRKNEE